jgi:flagellar biogenesis protein FliO
MGSLGQAASMIGTVILMIGVFVGAYYVSKFVGKRYQPRNGAAKNISILESQNVGKDKSILLVKAANRVFLIGSAPNEFSLISELDPDSIIDVQETSPLKKDFSSILRFTLMSKEKKQNEGETGDGTTGNDAT